MVITTVGVPIAVVERDEYDVRPDIAEAYFGGDSAAGRADVDLVAVGDAIALRVGMRHFHPYLGRGRLKLRCPSGFRPGMEVVHRATGDQRVWVLPIRRLMWRQVFGSLDDGCTSTRSRHA